MGRGATCNCQCKCLCLTINFHFFLEFCRFELGRLGGDLAAVEACRVEVHVLQEHCRLARLGELEAQEVKNGGEWRVRPAGKG